MEHYSTAFFCRDRKEPTCQVSIGRTKVHQFYNAFIQIVNKENDSRIDIHINTIQDLINFKNSFLGSYEKAMREAKDA